MIQTDKKGYESIKVMRDREKAEAEAKLRLECEDLAIKSYSKEQIVKWSNEHKGLWYLPILGEDGKIEALGIFKPINRHILSYASTKTDEGMHAFLEVAMRECFVAGDEKILEDDDYFIPASMKFNSILEGKKASLLKR